MSAAEEAYDNFAHLRRYLLAAGALTLTAIARGVVSRRHASAGSRPRRRVKAREHEREVLESEEFSRRLIANSYDCIKLLDLEGNLLLMGEEGRELMEIDDVQAFLHRPYLLFWNEEDRPRVLEALKTARAGKVGRFSGFSPSIKGTPRWWEVRITAIRNRQGRPARLLVIARDMTEAHQADEALRRSEAIYRAIVRALPGGAVCVVDGELRCQVLDGSLAMSLGLQMEKARGRRLSEWLDPELLALTENPVRQALAGATGRAEGRYRGRDLLCQYAPLRDTRGQVESAMVVLLDLTERKRMEEALREAMESACRASTAKDHFLAVLSHELRTPLTPVVAVAAMLEQRADLPHNCREDVQTIRRNLELETRLIDDLLDVTRIARGKIQLEKQPVKLAEVIHSAVQVCQAEIEAKELHFGLDLGNAAATVVHADPGRLQQVFWNLLNNAIKFTPRSGSIGIRCQRTDGEKSTGNGSVSIEVHDTGIGMETDTLAQIFKPFEQAGRGITRQFGGLGLGLAICRALVTAHAGTIEAHSDGRGKGSRFIVHLPVSALNASALPQHPPEAGREGPTARRLNILLVEDHVDTARIIKRLLDAQGHTVRTAGDLAGALERFGQEQFDLLISDLGLPDGSGLDLVRELRRRGGKMPAIALTGYGQEQDVQESHDAGFVTHLTKPASIRQLQEAIEVAAKNINQP